MLFKLKCYMPPAVLKKATDEALRIQGRAPGVLEYFFEANTSPFQHDWQFLVPSRFTGRATFDVFQKSADAGVFPALMAPYVEDVARGELPDVQDRG